MGKELATLGKHPQPQKKKSARIEKTDANGRTFGRNES